MTQLEPIRDDALRWARASGTQLRSALGKVDVELKGEIDLVTDADRSSEAFLVEKIRSAYPEHGIWAEEGSAEPADCDWRWIIDPLDGTTNFAHQIPHFATLLAVQRRGESGFETVVAVCYDPMREESFDAIQAAGARCNGVAIRVSAVSRLIESTGATGFPYDRWENEHDNHAEFCALSLLTRGVRRFGSAGLDLAWVAAGRYDFYWEGGLKPWDVAGGALLVQEAGGVVTAMDGGPFSPTDGNVAVAAPALHPRLIESLALARRSPINDRTALAVLRPSRDESERQP